MSLFNSIFNQGSFHPDHRDIILYNGYLPYRATGMFKANLIEFEQINDPSTVLYFNTNLSRMQYLDHHDKFELFRNKDLTDFTGFGQQLNGAVYFPTGRWFYSRYAKLWELMKENDPMEVTYSRDFDHQDDQFIVGRQCKELTLITSQRPVTRESQE